MAAPSTLRIGSDEGFSDAGVYGLTDPFPTMPLDSLYIRRLVETRKVAMADQVNCQAIGVPSWNDVAFAHRSVYAKIGALGALPRNLLFAYSPAAKLGYTQAMGGATGTTDTDVTGKTITFPASAIMDSARLVTTTGTFTAPLAAGSLDNQVWLFGAHGEEGVGLNYFYLRYTDANNWIRIHRQSTIVVRIEKNVASVVTTEADIAVPATEPSVGSVYALRINGAVGKVYVNGTLYATLALSAGAQALTGLLVGGAAAIVARGLVGEIEVWSTLPPYFTK